MNTILTQLRILAAFVAGLALAFILLIGVELLSNVVHPLPSEFKGTQEEICQHVAKYPTWVLAVVIVAWGTIAAVSTWTARRIGNAYSAAILGVLLFAGVGMNLFMLPYPLWFKAVMLPVVGVAIAWSGRPWITNSNETASVSLPSAS